MYIRRISSTSTMKRRGESLRGKEKQEQPVQEDSKEVSNAYVSVEDKINALQEKVNKLEAEKEELEHGIDIASDEAQR